MFGGFFFLTTTGSVVHSRWHRYKPSNQHYGVDMIYYRYGDIYKLANYKTINCSLQYDRSPSGKFLP